MKLILNGIGCLISTRPSKWAGSGLMGFGSG